MNVEVTRRQAVTQHEAIHVLGALDANQRPGETAYENADRRRAESHYTEGIEQLSRTDSRTELAGGRLFYGEWLRRNSRQQLVAP
jgi:hypothetical protein